MASKNDKPQPGTPVPGMPDFLSGYVYGECGHGMAGSEWRAGFRRCEHCGERRRKERD